jgi:glycosyltransferase involved in cell wall biosynthesis
MKILWFTWKDGKNPQAGGAEFINEELAMRLAKNGHQVILLVGGFLGCNREETINGYKIIRLGNRWTVYLKAYRYYRQNLKGWADLIIEEINTIPFLTDLYTGKEKRILLIYQLCREIWFYQMFFPLNLIGYLLEPLYLFFMRRTVCITESESTRNDLQRFGFDENRIRVFPVCIEMDPVEDLKSITKFPEPTVLSIGALRSMKRTIHQIEAFNFAKYSIPALKLLIAGDGSLGYKKKVLQAISDSPFRKDIQYLGRIDLGEKYELMQRSHIILVTSVKEGWGLIVTEAASQGTPAIVYNVDGLRDSVKDGYSGFICGENTPAGMATKIIELLADEGAYEVIRSNAWKMSNAFTLEKCYESFLKGLEILP